MKIHQSRSIKSIETFGATRCKRNIPKYSAVTGYGVFYIDIVFKEWYHQVSVMRQNYNNRCWAQNGTFNFVGVSTGTILRYTPEGETIERFNRIETVADGLSTASSAVPTIAGICNGALNTTKISTTFAFGVPKVSLETLKDYMQK